jgi:hypothetical protein
VSKLDEADLAAHQGKLVIFHCKSGARTKADAPLLAGKFGDTCEVFIVEGGLDAWRKAGLPVVSDRNQPLELQRQVQIGAALLLSWGRCSACSYRRGSSAVPAFVGAGLITAGLTGFCGMARILMRAPWNRSIYSPPTRAA